jgi:hypothetical protein
MTSNRHQQQLQLARWLLDWQLEEALGEEWCEPSEEGAAAEEAVSPPSPFLWPVAPLDGEPPVCVGDIRLVSPEITGADRRPLWVAVLADAGDGDLWLAPFGRFAEPALPGELRLTRETPPLRVLAVWAARRITAGSAGWSWLVDTLTDAERREAWAVHVHVQTGAPLPEDLQERVGPPLCHPDDPRVVYRSRETLAADRWQRALRALYVLPAADTRWQRAAESPPPDEPPAAPNP